MSKILCYAYAEDPLSCAVMEQLINYCNSASSTGKELGFHPGFPKNMHGNGLLKKRIPALVKMARNKVHSFVLTDLDRQPCASAMIKQWFLSSPVPADMLFRIAFHECESWLLADRNGIASYLGIPNKNFTPAPDTLPAPKKHLLDVIRNKGKKKFHKDMLPSGPSAHIGPEYNRHLVQFVHNRWDIDAAKQKSPSLNRAIQKIDHCRCHW